MNSAYRFLCTLLACLLLAACGGGGGGSGPSVAGIDRLGVSTGTLNGFGSIIVNGVRYEVTGQTSFDIDDDTATQDDLDVGEQVTVRWADDDDGGDRRALEVRASTAVRGPIDSIDAASARLVVLGQSVQVTTATSFSPEIMPRDISGLAVGQVVSVSGLFEADGVIRATRIGTPLPGQPLLVRGNASAVTAQTFSINALVVNFAAAELPDGPVSNGNRVKATGLSRDPDGRLLAGRVTQTGTAASLARSGDEAEIEGYITRFVSPTDFDVAGVNVTTTAATTYDDGSVASLALNVRVEVEGSFNAAGILVAREVEFEDDDDDNDDPAGRVTGNVTAVDTGTSSLAVAGVAITVTPATRLEDLSSARLRPFALSNINPGDYVEVRGTPGIGAALTASLLEREDANDDGRLRGPASAIAEPALSVLGVPVISNGQTTFRDAAGSTINAQAFFAAVTPGSTVSVRFSQSAQPGGSLVASRLELGRSLLGDSDDVPCPPALGAVVIDGNVRVVGNCTLAGTRVHGNVLVSTGGSLTVTDAEIDGNIQAEGGLLVVVERTQVNGDIQLDDLAGNASRIIDSSVDGNIQLEGNDVALLVEDNTVNGDIQAFGNTGGLTISGNEVDGNLQCQGNNPPPGGSFNQVSGNKEDQCAAL